MIEGFAKAAPEEVRAMYLALFYETQDVISRILAFKDQAGILLEKYGNGKQPYTNRVEGNEQILNYRIYLLQIQTQCFH